MKESPPIHTITSDPSVILTAVHSGEVVHQIKVGDGALAFLLSELEKNTHIPLVKQEYQIDSVGQEIFQTADKEFLFAIRGAFTALSWDAARILPKTFLSEGLTFAFVVSY